MSKSNGPDAGVTASAKLVRDYMREEEWLYHEQADGDRIMLTGHMVGGGDIIDTFLFQLTVKPGSLQMVWYLPTHAAKARRPAMAEFCMWANYGIAYGSFVMDPSDGELAFKLCVPPAALKGNAKEEIERLFGLPLAMLERYAPGIIRVLQGSTPLEAYEACERAAADGDGKECARGAEDDADEKAARPTAKPTRPSSGPGQTTDGSVPAQTPADALPENYSVEGLNLTSSVSLADIVNAVRRFRSGAEKPDVDMPRLAVLLSGVPGSGKTTFVRYLAREVGAPLRILKASDLLSRYVGDTEHKIAESFGEAKKNGEILFVDEIDSFLQDRKDAAFGFEVTQVNEMLQQIEAFGGVLVGASNLPDCLDKAVLRRFTYKVTLGYLTDEGKRIFFRRYFKCELTAEEQLRLDGIDRLAPGDFRTVKEGLYYLPGKQTNEARLAALESESAAKGRGTLGRIGFAA